MSNENFNETMIASFWSTTCSSAQSYALSMARRCSVNFATLISNELQRFIGQPTPRSLDELGQRQVQSVSLTSKIGGICHAARMAHNHPGIGKDILCLTAKFCEQVSLASDVAVESLRFTSIVGNLCHADTMRALYQ
jgi:hypothetical protein